MSDQVPYMPIEKAIKYLREYILDSSNYSLWQAVETIIEKLETQSKTNEKFAASLDLQTTQLVEQEKVIKKLRVWKL